MLARTASKAGGWFKGTKMAGAIRMGGMPLLGHAALKMTGAGAVAAGGAMGINWLQEATGVGERNFNALDWAGTILGGAGVGAGAGAMVGGPAGALVGGIIGAITAGFDAAKHEREDDIYEGKSKGDWFVEKDQVTKIHYGEMVVPARIAQAVRDELDMGQITTASSSGGGGGRDAAPNVTINLSIARASDHEAELFAVRVKKFLEGDRELMAIGAGRF